MSIQIRDEGRVRVVMIDRVQARNAVNPATAQALYAAFREFDADEAVDVAILTGAGGTFCAGFDLKTAADGSGGEWVGALDIPEGWNPRTDPMPGPMGPTRLMLSKPVIAAVEGFAVAGGLELAIWCDLRVAAEDATFGVYCRRWGVPLIDGGTVRLPAIIGQGRANDMVLTGRAVGASEASAMGLVNRVAPHGGALATALELAESLVRLPQLCMRADHLSARPSAADLGASLRREWASAGVFAAEGQSGAARFASGKGRGGSFEEI
ncbi:crotonase/enoyl-CoA hydratase family protein [Thalassobius vesicularis]|uniref:Crotonase/enoyl-CoA hydratase family protein n=1 Tax=Thalassobius vesicularis TaxID=1294297 RepID=A0A4S3M7D2_9RHOB|nr:crotonase/enoyl-CoA hydratase family protein [Thalassobius vesicularis]THD73268.1 crotonase/enoyl-CoA hydratase family protein [Thalassobius vesicularis]